MSKLILIDGNSMLTSAYFGTAGKDLRVDKEKALANMMKTKDGVYTNAVYSMTRTLFKLLKEQEPTHIAVAWDVNRETFRKELYPDYKGHRSDKDPELEMQFPIMQDVLRAINIAQFSFERFEADDIIGTLAKKFESSIPVKIVTKDQDALQLISDNTVVWLNHVNSENMLKDYFKGKMQRQNYHIPTGFFEMTPETFSYFYHMNTPKQIIDYKALEGDKSDNIPGVKGVGEKAILPLLKKFETVEEIYKLIDENNEAACKQVFKDLGISRSPFKMLVDGREMAYLSKKLATIKTDMEQLQSTQLDDLSISLNLTATKAIFERLEFKSFKI